MEQPCLWLSSSPHSPCLHILGWWLSWLRPAPAEEIEESADILVTSAACPNHVAHIWFTSLLLLVLAEPSVSTPRARQL